MKLFLILLVLLFTINIVIADDINIGSDIVIPINYEGNMLICNGGGVSYSVFVVDVSNIYIGTINPNQCMYVNESFDYKIYASQSLISAVSVERIEKKINQYWFIVILIIILTIIGIKVYREVKK